MQREPAEKGDSTTMCRPRSPMIKSTQDGEEEAESSHSWNCLSLYLIGDLPNL